VPQPHPVGPKLKKRAFQPYWSKAAVAGGCEHGVKRGDDGPNGLVGAGGVIEGVEAIAAQARLAFLIFDPQVAGLQLTADVL
jgi:hypothetical protein